jgi:hypothetical protein
MAGTALRFVGKKHGAGTCLGYKGYVGQRECRVRFIKNKSVIQRRVACAMTRKNLHVRQIGH